MNAFAPIRSGDVRPRRLWLVLAALIAVAGVGTGIALFVNALTSGMPRHTFAAGEAVTVHLNRDPRPGFYVDDQGAPSDRCYARSSSGTPIIAQPISGSITVEVNGRRWHVLSRLRLPSNGTYQVTCLKTATNAGARYGIGTPPGFTGFILAIMIPIGALLAALAITVVVLVRRSSFRRRLLAPPPPGWG